MQSKALLSLYFLALAGPASILAQVQVTTVWASETTIVTVTAGAGAPTPPANNNPGVEEKVAIPPPAAITPASSPPPPPASAAASSAAAGPSGKLQSSDSQICVNFFGNPDFHFLNAGNWSTNSGSNSGYGPEQASQCFDLKPDGALFVCENECQGSADSATAKYTKLECSFGVAQPNCDISLVDGFSLPLECTIPGSKPEKIGGTKDLSEFNDCPSPGDDNTCKNSNSYHDASSVPPYFQDANVPYMAPNDNTDPTTLSKGGNYCIWQTCSGPSDSFWPSGNPTIECEVGYRSSSSASKRNALGDGSAIDLSRRGGPAARARGHRHSHAQAHARGLKEIAV